MVECTVSHTVEIGAHAVEICWLITLPELYTVPTLQIIANAHPIKQNGSRTIWMKAKSRVANNRLAWLSPSTTVCQVPTKQQDSKVPVDNIQIRYNVKYLQHRTSSVQSRRRAVSPRCILKERFRSSCCYSEFHAIMYAIVRQQELLNLLSVRTCSVRMHIEPSLGQCKATWNCMYVCM